jgi:hypothetical protein
VLAERVVVTEPAVRAGGAERAAALEAVDPLHTALRESVAAQALAPAAREQSEALLFAHAFALHAVPPDAPRAGDAGRPSDAHPEAILALTDLAQLFRAAPDA